MEIMSSLVVEPLVSSLVENLVSSAEEFISFGSKHDREALNEWITILKDLSCYLQSADDKKHEDPGIREWMVDMEKLIIDGEDVIGLFNYEVLERQVKRSRLRRWLSTTWHLNSWELTGKLKDVTTRLQRLKDRREYLDLVKGPVGKTYARLRSNRDERDQSVSLPPVSKVFGRDGDIDAIISMLLSQRRVDAKIEVISIVGMGGLGKTTLAKSVYNDAKVRSHFEVMGWVCVSSVYDTKRVSREILESVTGSCDFKDMIGLDGIQQKINEKLRNKRFLLVLDDLWNDSDADWDALKSPFLEGLVVSKVIVTTRHEKVAKTVSTVPYKPLSVLSDEDCWSLVSACAELDVNVDSYCMIEAIGMKIAKKCGGLPLAARSVGGLLRNNVAVQDWERVVNNNKWMAKDVMSTLRMSYSYLPPLLKRCFAYLALIPEDSSFLEEGIVGWWIKSGLIQDVEVGRECFRELLSRSLILQTDVNFYPYLEMYGMHDLVRELAVEICYSGFVGKEDVLPTQWPLHISFETSRFQEIVSGMVKSNSKPLRTVILVSAGLQRFIRWSTDVPKLNYVESFGECLKRMKYVRRLSFQSLHQRNAKELFKCIGEFKLLKSVDLSFTHIQKLPTSVTSLYNLECLYLRHCNLQELPARIGRLIKLWCLEVSFNSELKKLPKGIIELQKLRQLSTFIIREDLPLSSLQKFELLEGYLEIRDLQKLASPEEARKAQLSEKRLVELGLFWEWGEDRISEQNECNQAEILEQLHPHEKLKELVIYGYRGYRLPQWLATSLRYLTRLALDGCWSCTTFPILAAIDSLRQLLIYNCPKMEVNLSMMSALKYLLIINCKEVNCNAEFNINALDVFVVVDVDMSTMLKDKVRLGCSHATYIEFRKDLTDAVYPSNSKFPYWVLSDMELIEDVHEDEMKLRELVVEKRSSLKSLPRWISNCKSLRTISISDCPSLTVLLPYGNFPSSLKSIMVCDCPNLMSFQKEGLPPDFGELCVTKCPLLAKMLQDHDQQLCSQISHIPYIELDGQEFSLP